MAALIKKLSWVFPLFFMITISTAFADNISSDQSTDKNVSLKDLSSQMKAMQDEINRLREEAEVRNKLEATVEEKTDHEKEILSAAGQDYSLPKEGNLEITYGFNYAYNDTDVLEKLADPAVDHSSNHNIINSIMLKYALLDNFSVDSTVPFVYKSDQRSTSNEKNATDIGDLSFGTMWQPKKSDGDKPTFIYNGSVVIPTGTSPYKIDASNVLSTGSGFYSLSGGASVSKSLDPVFAFGSASLYYPFAADHLSQRRQGSASTQTMITKVAPGYTIGVSFGMAYALSYTVSLNTSLSYAYTTAYKYSWVDGSQTTSGASTAAVFNIGSGWHLSPERTINTSLGIGLTNAASRFTFSFSIPYDFKL